MTTKQALCFLALPLASFACSKTSGGGASPDLIADFTIDNGLNPADGRQGGFYVYGDGSIAGQFDPPSDPNAPYPIDLTTGNSNGSGPGSFHTHATNWGVWGAALGADFMPKVQIEAGVGPDLTGYKGTYDASKYKGISFWAKTNAATTLTGVQVSVLDAYTDGYATFAGLPYASEAVGFTSCVYAPAPASKCSPYLVKLGSADFPKYLDAQIDQDWKKFDVLFEDTRQDTFNPGFHTSANQLDTTHMTAMAIQVNASYATNPPTPNDFEIWVDDVKFIK
jgi:hypothetical protein